MNSRTIFIVVVVIGLVLGSLLLFRHQRGNSMASEKLTSKQLAKILKRGKPQVWDVRTPEEYQEGHIPGAINVPLSELESEVTKLLPSKKTRLILYCRIGSRSKRGREILSRIGYTNVKDFGGINRWEGSLEK